MNCINLESIFYFVATARWQTFFKDAGIPGGPAGEYVLNHCYFLLGKVLGRVAAKHLVLSGIGVWPPVSPKQEFCKEQNYYQYLYTGLIKEELSK